MKTLLFVTYGGGHVKMIIPLLKSLTQRKDMNCVVFGLTTAGLELKKHDIPYRGFKSILEVNDKRAKSLGKQLAAEIPDGPVSKSETEAYLGLSYVDMEDRLGILEAKKLYEEKGRQAFLPLGPLRRIFEQVNPDLVITTISPRAEQAALIVAREKKMPSLCLVDLFAIPSLRRASEKGYGNRVCVISEQVRKWLIDAGRRPDEIVVTGNPAFDFLGDPNLHLQGTKLRAQRGWGKEKVILWASQIEPDRNPMTGERGVPNLPLKIQQELIRIVRKHADWRLVIRPHPNEHRIALEEQPRIELSHKSEDLHTLLQAVDLVVIMTSTVGLEARLIYKPLISIDLSVFSKDTPYDKAGLSTAVSDLNKLEEAIEALLKEGGSKPEGYPAPGKATSAVIKEIDELLMSAG